MKAICLSSGGLDSTTCMAIAREEGREIFSLSFLYGQRHAIEISAAQRVAAYFGAKMHMVVRVDMDRIGGSCLTDHAKVVPVTPVCSPEGTTLSPIDIPDTYVPARNLIFLSLATAWAEVTGAGEIFIGANAVDYSGYPDCRPEFLSSFEETARLGTKAGTADDRRITIRAPLLRMSKAEIIRTGIRLGVDYGITFSCYQPDEKGRPCGRCHSCQFRLKGFLEAGIRDPLPYISD